MIPKGVVTLDDFAVGIDYNKEPYTTNNRFSVITPDLSSQHKFFTVDNYTHRFLNKVQYPSYGSATNRVWTDRSETLKPVEEEAQRAIQTMPILRQAGKASLATKEQYSKDKNHIKCGCGAGAGAGCEGGARCEKEGDIDNKGKEQQEGLTKYGNKVEISPEKFAGQTVRAYGPLSKRCVACQIQGPPLKTFCMSHRSPRKHGIEFMRVLKVPGGSMIKLPKRSYYPTTMYEGFAES